MAILLILPLAIPGRAQAPAPPRPKVALVLSGGGALGLGHVGAIRELERLGIRPDMIVGTSMGAVVGGLYASGLDGAALESVATTVDWQAIFNPKPSRDNLTFRQKAQQADFPVRFSLERNKKGLKLPAGLVSDQILLQELRRFTAVRGRVARFDDLPIPFRAVATDIETGAVVVLGSGELPMAMRASMSVPAVFAPVRIDGRLLVDGGMAANIPIAVARDMGADIVIVVSIKSELLVQKDINSALDVLGQTVSLLIIANERAALATLKPGDILATIEPGGLTSSDFTKGDELIEAGRRALLAQSGPLAALAAVRGRVDYVQPAATTPPIVQYVRIENQSRLADAVIAGKVDRLVGRPADPIAINAALDRVYALGPFERVDYAIESTADRTGIVIRGEDSAPQAGRIRFGLTVSNNFGGDSDYAVSFDYRTAALDSFGSELQLQATIGDRNIVSAEYFKLLEPRQRWFATARLFAENRTIDLYTPSGFRQASYDLTYATAALNAGYQFGNVGELRLGLERGAGQARLSSGAGTPADIDIDIGRIVASAGLDTLDNPFFPNKGVRTGIRWTRGLTALGDRTDYQTVGTSALAAVGRGRHTLIAGLSGGTGLAGTTPVDALFRVGGLFNLSGYAQDELAGEAFLTGRLIYRYTITDTAEQLLGATLYAGGSIEAGNVWARRQDFDLGSLRLGGSVYVGADTALGPIYLAYGLSEGGRQSVYLFIGRPF